MQPPPAYQPPPAAIVPPNIVQLQEDDMDMSEDNETTSSLPPPPPLPPTPSLDRIRQLKHTGSNLEASDEKKNETESVKRVSGEKNESKDREHELKDGEELEVKKYSSDAKIMDTLDKSTRYQPSASLSDIINSNTHEKDKIQPDHTNKASNKSVGFADINSPEEHIQTRPPH
jgi:hypothetical protein